MATAIQAKPKASIHQLARQLFAETKGDEQLARQRWLAKVRQDPALVTEALTFLADIVMSSQISQQRSTLLRGVHAKEDRAIKDSGLDARGASNLMAFPLPQTHKALGAATKTEVQEALFFHRSHRTAHGLRERWFGLIWQAMKDDKLPVKRQLTETDLKNMEIRARKEEEAR